MAEHILILDDDFSTLEMLRMALEGEGLYQVTTADTLFEDIGEIERLHPDLILLDFKFGGRELGWNYLQKLKLHPATTTIPVILVTAAREDMREQEKMLLQQDIPVLYKPFDLAELLALVEQQLAHGS